MLNTPICEMLNIEYPILQGGMAWISDANLAAAVSNAGGMGIISAMNADAAWVRDEIKKARELTSRDFAINIMLMSPYADDVAKMIIDEGVKIVVTGAGDPSKYIQGWKDAGLKVLPVVASTAIAKRVEKNGADAVIAEGCEAGGHIGESTTMTLVPQVCDAVDIPVIAAGGIGDGRGIAASFMLGARGVQVGTRFLVASECNIHQNYKNRVLKAKDISTVSTGRRLGHPVRCLKSPFTKDFLAMEYEANMDSEALEVKGSGALRRAAQDGDDKNGCFMSGQIAGMIKKEQSCKEIIQEMFSEAELILSGANKWVK